MNGYYENDRRDDESNVRVGRLHISVTNLHEFEALIKQAKEEADQLQKTINRLSNFELEIEIGTVAPIFSES